MWLPCAAMSAGAYSKKRRVNLMYNLYNNVFNYTIFIYPFKFLKKFYDLSKRIQRGCLTTISKPRVAVMLQKVFSILYENIINLLHLWKFQVTFKKYTFLTLREIYIPIINWIQQTILNLYLVRPKVQH